MSSYVFKAGVYFKLPMLKKDASEEELVKFFAPLGCIPEDYGEGFDREGCALYFEEHLNAFRPIQDNENNWVLQYIMFSDPITNITPEFAITAHEMNKIRTHIFVVLGIDVKPVAFAYIWWSGTDEPFVTPIKVKL